MKTKVSRKKVSSCLSFLLKTQIDKNACKGKVNASCYLLTISICFFFQLTDRFIRDLMLVIVLPLFLVAVFILAVCLKFRPICKSQQRREEVIWLEFYDEVIQWSNAWKSNSLLHCSWRLSSPWKLETGRKFPDQMLLSKTSWEKVHLAKCTKAWCAWEN